MASDRYVMVTVGANTSQYVAGMNQAAKSADRTRKSTDSIGSSVDKTGKKMNTFKNIALYAFGYGIAAGAVMAARKVLQTVMGFEDAMARLAAASDASEESLKQMSDVALQAGRDTVFTATEAADAMTELAKAGVSTAEVLDGALAGALDLAAAGGVDVAFAAETAATAMVQFNRDGSEMSHIADLLAAGAGKAQGGVEELSLALRQGGQVASMVGWTLEDTTATLSAFASAGLLSSDAGTSLKTMLLRLANPANKAQAAMEQYGLSVYDSNGNMVGATELAGRLRASFEGVEPAARNAAMGVIFGTDAVRAANVMYEQGAPGIRNWAANVNDAGYAARVAERNMDTLSGDLQRLKGSFEAFAIEEGGAFTEASRGIVQALDDIVNALNSYGQATTAEKQGLVWMEREIETLGDLHDAYMDWWHQWTEGGDAQAAAMAQAEASDRHLNAMAEQARAAQETRDQEARRSVALQESTAMSEEAEHGTEQLTEAQEDLADAYDTLYDEMDKAWDGLMKHTSALQTNRTYAVDLEQAIDDLDEALDEEGVAIDSATGMLDLNTQAGRDAERAVYDLAAALNDEVRQRADNIRETQGHEAAMDYLTDATGKQKDGSYKLQDAMYQEFRRMGMNDDMARRYAEGLALTDRDIANQFTTPGLRAAEQNINRVRSRVDDLTAALRVVSSNGNISFDTALSSVRKDRAMAGRGGMMHSTSAMPEPGDATNARVDRLIEQVSRFEQNMRRSVLAGGGNLLPDGSYRVSSQFGMRGGRLHGGVNLAAPTGTPVFAPWPGTVGTYTHPSYGNFVRLTTNGAYDFLGAHLSRYGKSGRVNAGDIIGYVGSTGNSTGPHLHAEARRKGGARVNPRGILKYDTGGWLNPGDVAVNMSGRPEPILTNSQWQAIRSLAAGLNQGNAGGDTIVIQSTTESVVRDIESRQRVRSMSRRRSVR